MVLVSPHLSSGSDHPLELSALVTGTFHTYRRAPLPFLALALFAAIPRALSLVLVDKGTPTAVLVAFGLAQFLTYALAQPMTVKLAARLLEGETVSIAVVAREGARRVLSTVGTVMLSTLVIGFAFLLLIVPGIFASVALSLAVPVCILEALDPVESLHRSADLTDGHRWHVFGLLLTAVVASVLSFLLMRLAFNAIRLDAGLGGEISDILWAPAQSIFGVALYLALFRKRPLEPQFEKTS